MLCHKLACYLTRFVCNGTTGSDDEGLKPASIFAARKTKKDKATAKLMNENGNPSNPFSIETKSEVGGLRAFPSDCAAWEYSL